MTPIEHSPHLAVDADGLWSRRSMLEIEAHAFLGALTIVADLIDVGMRDPDWLYKNNIAWLKKNLEELRKHLFKLNLRLSIRKLDDIIRYATTGHDDQITLANIMAGSVRELKDRITQELEEKKIYCIDSARSFYLEDVNLPFGPKVSDKFPDIASDISEATYCVAMARNTACVFHLMRALESVVKVLGTKLGVTVIDKNNIDLEWGKIISNMNDAIAKLPIGNDRDAWAAASSLLYHVKIAWRNSTMHPKDAYTDAEAKAVYAASKAFTIYLSDLV